MLIPRLTALALLPAAPTPATCVPNTTSPAALQAALDTGGAGFVLSLCPGEVYALTAPLQFAAPAQEISTAGYPLAGGRAVLRVVAGTTAVRGVRAGLDYAALRHVAIDGGRGGQPAVVGGAAVEMGGDSAHHLVSHVRCFDPRAWSCIHVAEGALACRNATVEHCDVGPCGGSAWGQWADGISLACADSAVRFNTVTDATDGGVVVFGAPGSVVENNTITAATATMLGGINLVDVVPWVPGNYSHTVVRDNAINGGFAGGGGDGTTPGLIKIGIAVGPRVWFGDKYAANVSRGGVVVGNTLRGAFAFGIAVGGAEDFVLADNVLADVAFIGDAGPNCSTAPAPHPPTALLADLPTLTNVTLTPEPNSSFVNGSAYALTCFTPPSGPVWPVGHGVPAVSPVDDPAASTVPPPSSNATATAHPSATPKSAAQTSPHLRISAHLPALLLAALFIT
ncbi:hypothetical protein Q8F55_004986 [Vanrija albida]|uniref:Right handed beta helix domain-containing protein n=1 Tax=Vanrija albida TaxID=181172 RepID=A0ABR3Q104_9TREE